MKLIRKAELFSHFYNYLDGELSIGECIDKCETLDLSNLIIELEQIRDTEQDRKERLERVIDELKKWGWSND